MHLGSLFTALASYLDARSNNGKWLLRIDDLDTPRNQAGSADSILKCLDALGLQWDKTVYYQSQHIADYDAHLTKLARRQLTYRCECSRKTLAELPAEHGAKPAIYPGICRVKTIPETMPHAVRLITDAKPIIFQDALQGEVSSNLAQQHGDFILKRKDGIIAYQLAVVIDDQLQNVNHVVRGCDLLAETPKQIYLQRLLEAPTPRYKHVPLIVDEHGYKLSKQTLAAAVNVRQPAKTLYDLLGLLKQKPPDELQTAPVKTLLAWAISHWHPENLIDQSKMSLPPNLP